MLNLCLPSQIPIPENLDNKLLPPPPQSNKLKTKQFGLQRSKQNVPSGQSINHYVFLTILVLDHIRKHINEFKPPENVTYNKLELG